MASNRFQFSIALKCQREFYRRHAIEGNCSGGRRRVFRLPRLLRKGIKGNGNQGIQEGIKGQSMFPSGQKSKGAGLGLALDSSVTFLGTMWDPESKQPRSPFLDLAPMARTAFFHAFLRNALPSISVDATLYRSRRFAGMNWERDSWARRNAFFRRSWN